MVFDTWFDHCQDVNVIYIVRFLCGSSEGDAARKADEKALRIEQLVTLQHILFVIFNIISCHTARFMTSERGRISAYRIRFLS